MELMLQRLMGDTTRSKPVVSDPWLDVTRQIRGVGQRRFGAL
jgi:hypothetical protein